MAALFEWRAVGEPVPNLCLIASILFVINSAHAAAQPNLLACIPGLWHCPVVRARVYRVTVPPSATAAKCAISGAPVGQQNGPSLGAIGTRWQAKLCPSV